MRPKKSFLHFPVATVCNDSESRSISRKAYDNIVAKAKSVAAVSDSIRWEDIVKLVDQYIQTGMMPSEHVGELLRAIFTLLRIEIDAAMERSRRARQRAAERAAQRAPYGMPDFGALLPRTIRMTDDMRVVCDAGDDATSGCIPPVKEFPIEDAGSPSLASLVKEMSPARYNRRQRRSIEAEARRRLRKLQRK